ncbi:hypothetical protein, partial [Xylella fastidiosa]|uniref:hypothetical protein n=1 Tax=Xylella fastidiosa TaxID=2371 RepID=UPI00139688D0
HGLYRLHNERVIQETFCRIAPAGNPGVAIGHITLDGLEEMPPISGLFGLSQDVTSGTPQEVTVMDGLKVLIARDYYSLTSPAQQRDA